VGDDGAKVTASQLVELNRMALQAAGSAEEVVECARAAAALGDPQLLREVAHRISEEVADTLRSSGAWEAEMTYSKGEAWAHSGRRATALALAWGYIAPLLPAGDLRPIRSVDPDE
jgi:hypothetical protein